MKQIKESGNLTKVKPQHEHVGVCRHFFRPLCRGKTSPRIEKLLPVGIFKHFVFISVIVKRYCLAIEIAIFE